ncbi:MAG: hypothetical protein ACTHOH_05125 [Lysobacteraceae bacterium]
MRMMFATLALLAAGSAATGAAMAADPPCKTNFKEEGRFITGRRFTRFDTVTGVNVSTAFKRIYAEGTKSGLRVVSSDEKAGVISFEQPDGGSTLGGGTANLPWNVVIESAGKKDVKITVTKTTPGGYSTSTKFQIESICAVIDAARSP